MGILSRVVEQEGFRCQSSYANLTLAARVGLEVATTFADEVTLYGMSEHLFASDMFSPADLDSDTFLNVFSTILRADARTDLWAPFADVEWLRHLRDEVVPSFLHDLCAEILEDGPAIVGLTATFNQLMPCLALAKRLKSMRPELTIIAGGACFDGDPGPELHRRFPAVLDHVFLGEAEDALRAFLRARARRGTPLSIPGVTELVDGELCVIPGLPVGDLDTSPSPNYGPYFADKQRCEETLGKRIDVDYLPFESARGCWWGEKQQCTFCGINPDVMHFRSKTPSRVVEDVLRLSAEHGVTSFLATDWILSRRHADELFRRFTEANADLELFYEVRADLHKSQLMAMRRAGVNRVQPGIESLSTPLLKLMRKWTSGLRQVQIIRWCREVGIRPLYNLLHGMPGEQPEWYAEMARWIPALIHLDPPLYNLHPIEMHRFSPLFEERAAYCVTGVSLRADYRSLFPEGAVDSSRVGYFREYTSSASLVPLSVLQGLRADIDAWLEAAQRPRRPSYTYRVGPGFVQVRDARTPEAHEFLVRGIERDVLLLCDEVHTSVRLLVELRGRWGTHIDGHKLDSILDTMIRKELLLAEDGHVLTLPVGSRPRSTEELRALVLTRGEIENDTANREEQSDERQVLRLTPI
jgi:ribosomal peptide maturation radical SAM protein 1